MCDNCAPTTKYTEINCTDTANKILSNIKPYSGKITKN